MIRRPVGEALRSSIRPVERWRWKYPIATANSRCAVGTSTMPTSTARLAESSTSRKSHARSSPPPNCRRFSTLLARNGPRKPFAVRETSTSTLNSAKLIAMRRVRTPAMRAA